MTETNHAARNLGFTLIELMIAVAVIGVLAAIAYPSFMDAVRKSRRSDAFTAIAQVQQAQERWRSSNTEFSSNLTAAPNGTPPGLGLSAISSNRYYDLSIDSPSATGYSVIAAARSGTTQASDGNCVRLRLRVAGNNLFYGGATASGGFDESTTNRCWSR